MTYRRILPVVSALAGLLMLGWPVTILSQALQRSMVVSVVDRAGAPVPDLGPADFIIREDNVSREVLRAGPEDDPMQIAILVDNSVAARKEIANIRQALPGFIQTLTLPTSSGKRNEVAILGLAERPTILADYTIDRQRLEKAVSLIWEQSPPSGSYLLDAVIQVTRGFKKREAGRPIIVVLSSEGPDPSTQYYEQALKPLRDTGATLHVISLGPPSTDIGDEAVNRDRLIDEGTRISGGVRERLLTGGALPAKLRQFGDVLTHQYRVTYAHPDSLIPPNRVVVSVRRPELKARGVLLRDPQARR